MIAPLMFYAVVMTYGNQIQVVDTFYNQQACESASIQAWRYLREQGMGDIIVKCVPTKHRDVDLAQRDIKLQSSLK